jgi:hypothetical protein
MGEGWQGVREFGGPGHHHIVADTGDAQEAEASRGRSFGGFEAMLSSGG